MKFRIVEKKLKKNYVSGANHKKILFVLQYRTMFGGWKYVSFDTDENGRQILYLFHRYIDASRERARLERVNQFRIFGKPSLK